MQKLTKNDGSTPDMVEANIEQLREVFPEVFIDGKIDFDALKETLGSYVDDREERYSFTWHGKSKAKRIAQTPSTGTLLPCKEDSVDWDTTKNIFIEGDNLEVLKLLQKSYHRKVKMIYIDPPYNTGKEFIYPDKWQDNLDTYLRYTGQVDEEGFKISANSETSGRYHTNWLNMMYPRLKVARNLLREDGLIFVSIDDHEFHNLRQIMDEIFGSENFITTIAWQRVYTVKNSAKYFSDQHEYVLVYGREKDAVNLNLLRRTAKQDDAYTNPDNDPRGPWKAIPLQARNFYGRGRYSIQRPNGSLVTGPPSGTYWRLSPEKFQEYESDNRIWWGEDGSNVPAIKGFLSEVKQGITPTSLWLHSDAGSNAEAKNELRDRFPDAEELFVTPKPCRLIERMAQLCTNTKTGDIVLDFFAGSGSAGEAIFKLNLEDAGNRRFVLVQLPQKTGSSDHPTVAHICRSRLESARRAILASAEEDPRPHPDLGFKAFRLSSSNLKPWDTDFDELDKSLFDAIENIKPDRTLDDVLYELLVKFGLDLTTPVEERTIRDSRVFIVGSGALVACLGESIDLDLVRGIAALKEELKPEVMRVVFKDSGFQNDVVKTNAVQILNQAGIDDVKSL